VKEKGYTAEEHAFPVRVALGRMENILRTVTFCGVLSFWCLVICCLFAVNVEFLRIRGFLLKRIERKREK
jgi:hypothetical protein